ncbi:hypothetical protein NBRC10512_002253 [Rhodotorula toruloides]|uniref:RHTO0S08e07272g1_1 n=2 Tax=Rhodotorula toruloides TaxID=5286 RepID=A0A061BAC1_RHOTO|nr:uncharacterized protein RHTO_00939 [Rhodotorula toruloides NP11]EMS22185.1 hypothetical protein RHTO_00939 [Rhodotorula toruloides NP11]CDR43863.1 RHTO0S08e07272g1_1 [Rhodotorula toruloides]
MPAFLSLDLVLLIIHRVIDRDLSDEDWLAYRRRLDGLCLVCKDFRDAVQPVLWRTLRVKRLEQFHQAAGREGRNRHLLKHVQEMRAGDGSRAGRDAPEEPDEASFIVRYYLPNLRQYSSTWFGRKQVSLEGFGLFERLTTLRLYGHRLSEAPLDLRLPALQILSLDSCDGPYASFQRLLLPETTPRLQKLHTSRLRMHMPALSPFTTDLSRLRYALVTGANDGLDALDFLGLDETPVVVKTWHIETGLDDFDLFFQLTPAFHLQLYASPWRRFFGSDYTQQNEELDRIVDDMMLLVSHGRVKSLLLPSDFDDTTWFTCRWTRAAFFALLESCHDFDVPVVVYDESERRTDDFSPAFERFLASSGDADFREGLLDKNAERVRIWSEYTAEKGLQIPPDRP